MLAQAAKWLFSGPQEPRRWWEVILWWEIRRIPYNLILGVVGLVSLLLFFLFVHLAGELYPGEDVIEPIALLLAPILVNIAYTAGWIAELFLRVVWRETSSTIAPILFKLGLSFSLLCAVSPAMIWFVVWVGKKC